jgi:hypothetical protein
VDRYKKNLSRAGNDWREDNALAARKDRRNGRAEKRSAKQGDRREIERDAQLPTRAPCKECGEPECPGAR